MTNVIKVAVVYHSGYGHTQVQAEAVHAGAQAVDGVEAALYPVDEVTENLEKLADADAIIFGTPTYMGTVSAPFKTFMDATSGIWMEQGWKDKIAGGFTNSSSQSGDKLSTLQALSLFGGQHGMIWVGLDLPPGNNSSVGSDDNLNRMGASLGAMAQSLADLGSDVQPPQSDRDTAAHYGTRIAKAALRWAE